MTLNYEFDGLDDFVQSVVFVNFLISGGFLFPLKRLSGKLQSASVYHYGYEAALAQQVFKVDNACFENLKLLY